MVLQEIFHYMNLKSNQNAYYDGTLYMAKGRAKELWQDAINCFIDLKGIHRFRDDLKWGKY